MEPNVLAPSVASSSSEGINKPQGAVKSEVRISSSKEKELNLPKESDIAKGEDGVSRSKAAISKGKKDSSDQPAAVGSEAAGMKASKASAQGADGNQRKDMAEYGDDERNIPRGPQKDPLQAETEGWTKANSASQSQRPSQEKASPKQQAGKSESDSGEAMEKKAQTWSDLPRTTQVIIPIVAFGAAFWGAPAVWWALLATCFSLRFWVAVSAGTALTAMLLGSSKLTTALSHYLPPMEIVKQRFITPGWRLMQPVLRRVQSAWSESRGPQLWDQYYTHGILQRLKQLLNKKRDDAVTNDSKDKSGTGASSAQDFPEPIPTQHSP